MRRIVLPVGALALLLGVGSLSAAWAEADVVAQRKQVMKNANANMEAIKAVVGADAGAVSAIVPRAEEIRTAFSTLPALFPAGSTQDTKARPEVWSDRAGFETAAANATAAAAKLVAAATANDSAASAAAFRELGGACGACHRSYRAR